MVVVVHWQPSHRQHQQHRLGLVCRKQWHYHLQVGGTVDMTAVLVFLPWRPWAVMLVLVLVLVGMLHHLQIRTVLDCSNHRRCRRCHHWLQ
jgi:hypothetical protein